MKSYIKFNKKDWIDCSFSNSKLHKSSGLTFWHEKEGKQGNLSVEVMTANGGLCWKFRNKKGEELSIICHSGSYGGRDALFEIMPSYGNYHKKWGDSVKGYLTFGEVQKYINKLSKK